MSAENPGSAQDGETACRRADTCLANLLASTVCTQGRRWLVWSPGLLARAVEDIVRRHMQNRYADFGSRFGQRPNRGTVDRLGNLRLGLGPVNCGVGGCVDDHVGLHVAHDVANQVGNHELGPGAAKYVQICLCRSAADQFCCNLPGFSEDGDFHVPVPSRCPTPWRSRSGRHQYSFARYQSIVRARPSSSVTEGRQPSSSRMRAGSIA